ncbi:MAG TPA: tetratricopeptide repeat protein, partial [Pilimelia sp.]|nr:tetratricopeptide repeat protein [Pilimelia sp.]
GGDPAADVRAVFSWSYHLLPAGAARLFRLLGLHWGDEVTLPAAASLAGVPAAGARRDVAELVEAGLLAERTPGRYALHDLLRTYAGELLAGTDTEADRGAALHRLVEHHLHTALAAALLTHPHFSRIDVPPAGPGVTPQPLVDAAAAGRWFTAEHPVLVAAVGHAARAGLDRHAWQLAWAIAGHLDRRGRWAEWSAVGEAALAAATRAGDRSGQAHAHRDLARVRSRQGRPDDAQAHLLRALKLFGPAGDRAGLAHTHLNLGQTLERAGRVRQALGHSEQALELFAAAGSAAGHAFALNAVGWQHALLGDHRRAVSYCEEALHRLAALGDEQGQADTWDSLGYAHHHLGDHRRAIDCYRRALAVFTATGNRYGEASTLDNLGQAHLAAADVRAARDAWRSALTIFHQLGHADAERVLDRLGDLERAAAPHGSLLGSAPA